MATDYSNPGGTGDRTGLISVTANFTPNGSITNLVDGDFSTNTTGSFDYFNGSVAGLWIQFEFATPQVIDEAKWYQSNTTTHGQFKWQLEIGGVWTDIGSAFALGGATTQTQTQLNGNTLSSTKYRLLGVSGIFFNSPWIIEIEFRLEEAGAAGYTVEFNDDGASTKVSLVSFIEAGTTQITTPGADTFAVPPYDLLVIELWGGGASGAAMVQGFPDEGDLGEAGGDTTLSILGYEVTAGGGKPATYAYSMGDYFFKSFHKGGDGGTHSGNYGTGADGQSGEAGRSKYGSSNGFGAAGGDAPNGGQGGDRQAPTVTGGSGLWAVGDDGEAPGGGGGGGGAGGNGGPVIGNDVQWNKSFGGGGAGGYRRLEFHYMDPGSPEVGDIISFDIGAGGAAPTGLEVDSVTIDGGAGGNGAVFITVDAVPPPPPPDTGQGTVTIVGTDLRVGSFIAAQYNDDDPDGGEHAFFYQWKRSGAPIEGATGVNYQLAPEDVGENIGVTVTYTDANGYTESIDATQVGPVLAEKRPLDDLLDGLFKAFSLRWLNSEYTGPIIRLRSGTTIVNDWGWQQTGTPSVDSSSFFRFDFGTPRLITEARMIQNSHTTVTGQGVWQWRGSHDASSWTDIGGTFTLNAGASLPMTELNGNTTSYRYYELRGVSGTWQNHLVWEIEFKIDDNGQTRNAYPGQQSYENPGGEGPRNSMIEVTTSFSAGGVSKIVSGKWPDARKSFWPNYATGELDPDELAEWQAAIMPTTFGSTISILYDQSGNGRHLDSTVGTTGGETAIWNSTGTPYMLPNGRFSMLSNGNASHKRNSADSPQGALSFLEVIKRHNARPIRHWQWPYAGDGDLIAFIQPTSAANDWEDNAAVLVGDGYASGAPRAVTSAVYDESDADAVVWDGTLNTDRVAINRNGARQALSVATPGYTNKAGTVNFRWPNPESETNLSVRLCELVFWDIDVEAEKPVDFGLYRLDVMLNWLDEMPEPELFVIFDDQAELDVDFTAPIMPLELSVEFTDDAWMSAIHEGANLDFSIAFSDDALMQVTFTPGDVTILPIQMVIINTGGQSS